MSIADQLRFDDAGLIPAAITDCESGRLLVLCFMNREALEKTLSERRVHLFRRSRGQVVAKGVDSGHVQEVDDIRINCDANSIEVRVRQHVAACAHGYYSCYYRKWDFEGREWIEDDDIVFDPEEIYSR